MFFVYVDYTDDGQPFYVGKGTTHRVKQMERNQHHDRVAAKHGCRREVVLETPFEFEAFNREIRLVAELHTFTRDPLWNGIGTNHTIGGEGPTGKVVSAEGRARMSAAKRNMSAETKAKIAAASRNKSVETREKISAAGRRRKHSPETKAKMAASHKGKKLAPPTAEARANMSAAHKGKPNGKLGTKHSDAAKAKMAASHIGKKATDETRAKMVASQHASMTDERREKLRLAALAQWARKNVESKLSDSSDNVSTDEIQGA